MLNDRMDRWPVRVYTPFAECPAVLIGQIAARSAEFEPSAAGGGTPVIIGCAAGDSVQSVTTRARGELAERVSNVLAGRIAEARTTIVAPFTALGRRAVDPAAWRAGAAGMRSVPMLWVPGRSLITGQEVLLPASTVFLHHRPPPGCGSAFRTGSTGLAAHAVPGAAIEHALLELLERDLAYRAWYLDGLTCTPPIPTPDALLGRAGLGASVLVLPGPGVRCVVVCLHTRDGRAQSYGLRCTAGEPASAVMAAVYEALLVRSRMSTRVAQAAWQRIQARVPPLPHDIAERATLTYHRADSLAYWQAKAVVGSAAFSGQPGTDPDLAHLLAEHTGQDVIAVETTIPQVKATGTHVVRVVAPGAYQLPGREPAGLAQPPHPIS